MNYQNPTKIIWPHEGLSTLKNTISSENILLVTSPGFTKRGVVAKIQELLGPKLVYVHDKVDPNPDMHDLQNTANHLKQHSITEIIALGGGSVIDTAKVLASILSFPITTPFNLPTHLTTTDGTVKHQPLPLTAVPTTAGTGSEVTPFATVWDHDNHKKYSLHGPAVFPTTALMIPELALTLPKDVTIETGLDAISQGLEAIWNHNANPITTTFATQAIKLGLNTLPKLIHDLTSLDHRTNMMNASLYAGLAISTTRTAIAHSISYPLTSHYSIPHGIAASFALPEILAHNKYTDTPRFTKLANNLDLQTIEQLEHALATLTNDCKINTYFQNTITTTTEIQALSPQMHNPTRATNNLQTTTHNDITNIVTQALKRLQIL